jgi:hypothetical protein
MNRPSALSLAIVLACLALATSSPAQNKPHPTVISVTSNTDCQIAMQATIDGRAIATSRGDANGAPLHLTITNLKSVAIVGIDITLRDDFLTTTSITPAQSAQTTSPGRTKTIDLHLRIAPNSNASADANLPSDFAALSRIDVSNVTFADGTIWRSTATRTCHIFPNPARLI